MIRATKLSYPSSLVRSSRAATLYHQAPFNLDKNTVLEREQLNQRLSRFYSNSNNHNYQQRRNNFSFKTAGLAGSFTVAFSLIQNSKRDDGKKKKLISWDELQQHKTADKGIWVEYKNKVYDITQFQHPGGPRIRQAAGSSVEPYFELFTVHKQLDVEEILKSYYVGDLDPKTKPKQVLSKDQLFKNEPPRSDKLVVRSQNPFNAETAPGMLDSSITPNDLFYVRNHLPVPEINYEKFNVQFEHKNVKHHYSFDLKSLEKYPKTTITATLQCAGNRRQQMNDTRKVHGLAWSLGAIGNATWSGVTLRTIFERNGVDCDALIEELPGYHVCFEGGDGYGASVPIEKALSRTGDVLIATEMNGVTMPVDHGKPFRLIVPGHVAARSVKWLQKIYISPAESTSHWQRRDYKGFNPSDTMETINYDEEQSIQEVPVQSAFTYPTKDCVIDPKKQKTVTLKGYAFSGGGRRIIRVDLSADGGKTWFKADLQDDFEEKEFRTWNWKLWSSEIDVKDIKFVDGKAELICKAVDSSYNVQPNSFEEIYNVRGVLSNAFHRITVLKANS